VFANDPDLLLAGKNLRYDCLRNPSASIEGRQTGTDFDLGPRLREQGDERGARAATVAFRRIRAACPAAKPPTGFVLSTRAAR
jgi:hypothetical protein